MRAKRCLGICGDRFHPSEMVLDGLRSAGGDEFTFEMAPSEGGLENASEFDVVVLAKLNVVSPTDPTPWADDHNQSLIRDFVASGQSLFVIHGGTAGYAKAPLIREITGGLFIQHPASCEVQLEPVFGHPLTVGASSFSVHDEHYFVDVDSDLDVFLHARSQHGVQPAGWTRTFGKGKVCVLTPGHGANVWEHPAFLRLIKNGLQWISTGT